MIVNIIIIGLDVPESFNKEQILLILSLRFIHDNNSTEFTKDCSLGYEEEDFNK